MTVKVYREEKDVEVYKEIKDADSSDEISEAEEAKEYEEEMKIQMELEKMKVGVPERYIKLKKVLTNTFFYFVLTSLTLVTPVGTLILLSRAKEYLFHSSPKEEHFPSKLQYLKQIHFCKPNDNTL